MCKTFLGNTTCIFKITKIDKPSLIMSHPVVTNSGTHLNVFYR